MMQITTREHASEAPASAMPGASANDNTYDSDVRRLAGRWASKTTDAAELDRRVLQDTAVRFWRGMNN